MFYAIFLDVDDFWLRRFWLGFDRHYQVEIYNYDKKGNLVSITLDDISSFGIKLAKKYTR